MDLLGDISIQGTYWLDGTDTIEDKSCPFGLQTENISFFSCIYTRQVRDAKENLNSLVDWLPELSPC